MKVHVGIAAIALWCLPAGAADILAGPPLNLTLRYEVAAGVNPGGEPRPSVPDGNGVVNKVSPTSPGLTLPKGIGTGRVWYKGAGAVRPSRSMLIPIDPKGRIEPIPTDIRHRLLLIGR